MIGIGNIIADTKISRLGVDMYKEKIIKNEGSRYKVKKLPNQEKTDNENYKNRLKKLLKDGKIKEAEELIKKALKEFPDDKHLRAQEEKIKKIKEILKE